MITGTHDNALVILSIIIAMVASYTALDLAGRTRAANSRPWSSVWLTAASLAMGGGIWSMHFVAMLAYSMPGMEASYDPGLTLLSFVLPVGVTGTGFAVVSRSKNLIPLFASGLLMGIGIVAMHYTGMAAMQMPVDLSYDAFWVAVSIFIAIGASIAALWLAFRSASFFDRAGAAIVMGCAISGMHFAGMRAATFSSATGIDHAHGAASFGQTNLALIVSAITLLILFLAIVAAMFDRRFVDMAEREAAALRRSEELFRALYRRTPMPLHALDLDGRLQEVSDAWLNLLGYSREEVVGRPLVSFMTEESAERRRNIDWPKLLATGGPMAREYELRTRSNRLLNVLSTSRVAHELENEAYRVIGGLIDLTDRKKAEQALVQSQKMEAVGQLTGGVAHDFNNLLAVILGNLELLKKRMPPDPRTDKFIDNAIEGARRGASLTQRMLSFARKQEMHVEPVNIPHLINGMMELLRSSIGSQMPIETHVTGESLVAMVDPHQLELAILNLVVNARDAMPEGGVIALAISRRENASADLAPGPYISIAVRDTGAGMDEETLSRAQEPFFTTKGVGKGTGLGLSMVHGFAAQSGGALLLKSAVGLGTTAEILLPATDEHSHSKQFAVQQDVREVRPLSVLAVDDDALVLMNTTDMLIELGHKATAATSGNEALELLRSAGPYDLLVTDQAMPGMLGIELCRMVRSIAPGFPVIIATGYGELANQEEDVVILSKPFDEARLRAAISQAQPARIDH